MGRFLVRVSNSNYRNHIVLKGGALIASIISIDKRSTMDIDTTLVNLEMNENQISRMLKEILSVESNDNIIFRISSIETIMEDFDYPGIRVKLNAQINRMRTPLILDFSTGDVLTPSAIEYSYELMFDQGHISVLAYNIETLLAEKFETIISRGTANTRMRDFYDVYSIVNTDIDIQYDQFILALENTSKKRGSYDLIKNYSQVLNEVEEYGSMRFLWTAYQRKFDYAENIEWDEVMKSIKKLGNHLLV
ncbi:nucleotidyl transferase AbiEii/AbiGii toxin family protein [Carnobacterium sp. TMP28]|uniref:nucleotidyl transferase AbiEii/AbiGii toxin family protein n=1 Tax=Carnobacterium sp. TMP28 TaxID=3397060 RepID=UPI0039E175FF